MGGQRRKAKAEVRRGRRTLLASLVLGTSSLVLGGCANQDRPAANDPLLGGPPMKQPGRVAAPAPGTPIASVPSLPAPATSTSTAALASGTAQPLDATHDLRIGGAGAGPVGGTPVSGAPTDGWKGQAPGGVVLRGPETAGPPPSPAPPRQEPAGSGITLVGGARVASFEQAQAVLRARGVTRQLLELDGGRWKFSCWIPNRQNPDINHMYESPPAPDPVSALQAVIDQIERELR
jgi:hypothetical protein